MITSFMTMLNSVVSINRSTCAGIRWSTSAEYQPNELHLRQMQNSLESKDSRLSFSLSPNRTKLEPLFRTFKAIREYLSSINN